MNEKRISVEIRPGGRRGLLCAAPRNELKSQSHELRPPTKQAQRIHCYTLKSGACIIRCICMSPLCGPRCCHLGRNAASGNRSNKTAVMSFAFPAGSTK